ncbi:hypothetical protein ACFX11_046913 [Malus domestica]
MSIGCPTKDYMASLLGTRIIKNLRSLIWLQICVWVRKSLKILNFGYLFRIWVILNLDDEGGDEDGVDGKDDEEEGDGKGVEVGEGTDEDGVNGKGDEEEGDGEDIEVGEGANGDGELLKLEGRISLLTYTTDAL